MKKLIFMFVLTVVSSLTISGCTEDNISPKNNNCPESQCGGPGGGGVSENEK
jgi:hypothetical protein